jgi:hypothetical protein
LISAKPGKGPSRSRIAMFASRQVGLIICPVPAGGEGGELCLRDQPCEPAILALRIRAHPDQVVLYAHVDRAGLQRRLVPAARDEPVELLPYS